MHLLRRLCAFATLCIRVFIHSRRHILRVRMDAHG